MNRKEFLKGASLAGLGLALPGTAITARSKQLGNNENCVLVPTEVAGPFPLDLTENSFYFRQDIREDAVGVQLNLRLRILGLDNCNPMPNVRVNIWHCTNDGIYTGYNTGNNPGNTEDTHLRGYQFADANGEVEFITIFPGWYPGRICHIHIQVYVSSSYAAVSQFTFPVAPKNALYAAHSTEYPDGEDPVLIENDFSFSDGAEHQTATLVPNGDTGGYSSFLELTVQGSGTTGIGHIERETAKVFELGQNFPNPYLDQTLIPIKLKQAAHLKLELWNLSGKKMATILDEKKGVGEYQVEINPGKLGLPNGNYVYQLEARKGGRVFRLPKMMTVQG